MVYEYSVIQDKRSTGQSPLFECACSAKKYDEKLSSAYKYAKYCYYLKLYINGDMTAPVEDIFSCRIAKASQSAEHNAELQQEKKY